MRFARRRFEAKICAALAAAMLLFSVAATAQDSAVRLVPPALTQQDDSYKLGTGDKVRIIVFGEDDLGGAYEVDSSGMVQLPLIGQVQAADLTVRQFEGEIAGKLNAGYLKDARVSVEVTAYRPFYIIGEVSKPGEYPYVNGLNVITAVALAGGYTYRADDSEVYIQRKGSSKEQEVPVSQTTQVNPGDIVRVPERFF